MPRWAGSAAALALALGWLRLLAGAGWLHRLVQRVVAPPWARRQAPALPSVLARFVTGDGELESCFREAGLEPALLPAEARRHLPELQQRFACAGSLAQGAAITALALGWRAPAATLRWAGWILLGLGLGGVLGALFAFPLLWARYHRLAYRTEDWRLPAESLLAILYPEPFYRLLALAWGGGIVVAGGGLLASNRLLKGWR
jgi:hypothetical protein